MPPLRDLIFAGHDPYAGLAAIAITKAEGWYYDHPIFEQLIKAVAHRTIIEVGSLYGASAIHMANICRRLGRSCEIVCVDTFLGSLEHWGVGENADRSLAQLKLQNGFPRIYEAFLSNVVGGGVADIITPCPMTSAMAARMLAERAVAADLVYLDAGHDYASVAADIRAFWPLVRPGGVLFGDDFDLVWPGVIRAVVEWGETERVAVRHITAAATTPRGREPNTKWYAQKAGG